MRTPLPRLKGVKPVTEPELRRIAQARRIKATVKRWTTRGIIEQEALIESLRKSSPSTPTA
ncbi:hypothetical protein SAMN05444169_7657 [Bradyrhizobium erythrophlei]|uniref:Uncharacterized protein n=1 Tax=Bradyrhizobium erythrophlei TaxID=1437360 RepID=A0A1M5TAZ1_9BRAD|nr:hypothetical protein SAMN05444169_7657 [Bradyrhizobium erythrophlei]